MAKAKEQNSEPKVDPVVKIVDRIIDLQGKSLPAFAQQAGEIQGKIDELKKQMRMAEDNFTACNGRINEIKKTAEDLFGVDEEALGKLVEARVAEMQAGAPPETASPDEDTSESKEDE